MERAELARALGAPSAAAEPRDVVICEGDPVRFMAAFVRAVAEGGNVFLCDPMWGAAERAQAASLADAETESPPSETGRGWLMIPSGGTGGQLKFARHDQDTIFAAVRGFAAHFNASPVNAVGVLPLHHVSGLMGWMRCALTGGDFLPWSWKNLEAGRRPAVAADERFLSLVPTQLQRLLAQSGAVEWLRFFRAVFLGGGPAWPELLERAAAAHIPLVLSYGLTETAAMAAAQRPGEFLAGERGCGAALPHVRIAATAEGVLRLSGESVFRGYFPEWRAGCDFVTEDLGQVDERGQVRIAGRRDDVIITGGKKVRTAELEAALRATGEFDDVAVIGLPDAEWGQAIAVCYPAEGRAPDLAQVKRTLADRLAPHARPKRFAAVTEWPRNAQGKLNRAALITHLSTGADPGGEGGGQGQAGASA